MWFSRGSPKARRRYVSALAMLGLAMGAAHALDSRANSTSPGKVTVYGAKVAATMPAESVLAREIGRPDNLVSWCGA